MQRLIHATREMHRENLICRWVIMIDNIPVINAVRPTAFEIQEIKKYHWSQYVSYLITRLSVYHIITIRLIIFCSCTLYFKWNCLYSVSMKIDFQKYTSWLYLTTSSFNVIKREAKKQIQEVAVDNEKIHSVRNF